MRAVHDFIVFQPQIFNKTFKTKGKVELYGDERFLQKRLANTIVIIKRLPLGYEGSNIIGYQALIDPTIYFTQIYDHGKGDNQEIKGYPGYFKVQKSMIVMIRKDDVSEWIGFGENLAVELVMEDAKEEKSGLIITEIKREPKNINGLAKVFSVNQDLQDSGVKKGDKVFIERKWVVSFWIDGDEYLWIRNCDVLAKYEEDGNK
ncbi:co-chaperone GroES [Flavobacterium sp. HSC-61S13]|uniref:co-chaperone GroES n=1 Tax=Flavobacterium sp. HSC-61S13 TaxID=2910963 RepID=UPI00209D478E|nr:co-chaperone GroES [Flavobacterium sp. HSC-61S13]MCP1996660.1 co-chaperonin GroES (HSP10) [Flavobacterium sp. HSC-61S13]